MSSVSDISVIGSPHASAVMGLVAAHFGRVDPSDRAAVERFFATLSTLDPEMQAAVVDEVERLSLASEIDPEFRSRLDFPNGGSASGARTDAATRSDLAPTSHARERATASPREQRRADFGLVIGIDHYPRFQSLQGAAADATAFCGWLCDKDGGGVAPANVRLMVSRPEPAAPSQDDVDEQLLELVKAAEATGGGRRLYFHFSGHGAASFDESGEDVALLLPNWSRSLSRRALSIERYHRALRRMRLFEELVITLDCSWATTEPTVGIPPTITHQPQTQPGATRTFIAYATTAPMAYEAVGPDPQPWTGLFTRCLLRILRRSPSAISAAELGQVLEREIPREAHMRGEHAHVVVNNELREDSTFGRQDILPTLVITFGRAQGRARLRNGHHTVIAERDVSSEPWELSLEEGLYKLEDDSGGAIVFDHAGRTVTRIAL